MQAFELHLEDLWLILPRSGEGSAHHERYIERQRCPRLFAEIIAGGMVVAQRTSVILEAADISDGAICRDLDATAFVHGAQSSIVVESRLQKNINIENN